jgi:hypothetical protein
MIWTPTIMYFLLQSQVNAYARMCIYIVICLMKGPQRLPKPLFRTVRSGVSYFNLQYPLLSLRSNSSCLHFVPRPSVTYLLPFIFPSIPCLKGSSNARCDQSIKPSFSLLFEGYSSPLCLFLTPLHFSHDRPNWPSATPRLKTLHVYLIYFPKCQSLNAIQSYPTNIQIY